MILTAISGRRRVSRRQGIAEDRFKVAALPPLLDKRVFEELTRLRALRAGLEHHAVGEKLKMDLFPEEV
jgi:hypothetical protein